MAIFQVTNTISTLEKLPLKNGYIYYIANLDNLSDIMSHGISAISTDPKRSHAEPIYGKAISEYVSLYFNPRNATLYSAQKSYRSKVIILQIHKTALLADGVIFTNASATAARYECANELSDLLNTQFISWSEVMSKGWNHADRSIKQSKRDKMMAEALVPTHLPIDMIAGIICQDSSIAKSIASDYNITAVADMEYFFPIKLYAPQSKDELKGLIYDEDIYLGDIDTSAITDMSELFAWSRREDFSGIENWDVSSVTDMGGMFRNCTNFNQPLDSWDVSSVTNMSGMFINCYNFNQPLNSWDVSSVTDMSEMFSSCENFNQPLNSWDVSSVTDMSEMFINCYNFNQPLNNWDVSSVIYMSWMFDGCKNFNQPLDSWRDKPSQKLIDELPLICFIERKIVNNKTRYYPKTKDELISLVVAESLNLGDIDTSAITDMSWLFYESWRKDFSGIENWDVSSVTDMGGMFAYCENFNQPLNNWGVSNVTDVSEMFSGCTNFNQPLDNWRDKLSQELINELPVICFIERKIVNNKTRYYPKTKDELRILVRAESLNLGDIDTSAITDMNELFYESERKDFSGIESWDVSNVTNMSKMFKGCYNFNQPLNSWDVSNVTDTSWMFAGCTNFNQPLDNWDVFNVTDMRGMFDGCENFNQPLDNWDVFNVTDTSWMFAGCTNFNQPLNSWDISSVIYMREMFEYCTNFNQPLDSWKDKLSKKLIDELPLIYFAERKIVNNKTRYYPKTKDELISLVVAESLNLGDIDTSAITDMSWLFYESWRKDFSGIENWDVSSVTDMSGMFRGCENFNQSLDNWDVSSVTNMSMMFRGCTNFNQPLDNWDVSSVANMSDMFADCENFNQPLNNWDVSSVTNMSAMFYECYNFNQPLNNWDVSSVTNMSYMFYDCENFNQPLDNWDVSSVVNMSEMFDGCINFNQPLDSWRDKLSQELIDQLPLIYFVERKIVNNKTRYYPKTKDELRSLVRAESLNLGDIDTSAITDMSELFYKIERRDFSGIESWDVSSVTDMGGMFAGVENFNQPLNNWDVSSVTDMRGMFYGCYDFNQPLNNWNVSSVTNMCAMFAGCYDFNQPLNNWNVSSVTNMCAMFAGCYDFNQPLNNWNVSSVTDMGAMLTGCYNFNQPLNNWNVSSVTDMYEMFYNCENFNQPLDNWNVSSVTDMSLMFDGCKINDENKPKFTNMYDLMEKDDDEIPF